MPWPLLSLLSLLVTVSTEEPCKVLSTEVSGDSVVTTIDCDDFDFRIIVTCAQEATEGCSSQKEPKVQSSTLSDTSVTSSTSSSSSSTSFSSSSSSSTSSSSSSSTSTSTTSSSTSSSSTSSSTSTCIDCTTSTTSSSSSSSSSTINLSVPDVWINGVLTFRSQSATEPQVALAVRETFRSLVRPEEVRVSVAAVAVSASSVASAASTTWRAAFGVGEATAAAHAARATLQALAERVAAARAMAFTAELKNQLMDAGATPGGDFLIIELTLDESSESTESTQGNAWWVLLLVFGLLALALLVLVLRRRSMAQGGGLGGIGGLGSLVVSKALWELEEERWELAEKVLETKAPPVVPQQWKAQWSAASNDGPPETRYYDLTFGIGGKLDGIGEGRNGTFEVTGAFDMNDGSVRWREVARSGGPGVVECYGQWDGMRIDGFFTAFDVSTLPQQIGQGHFALSGRVKAAKDAAPKPPLSDLSSSEAREAREAREVESDMV